MNIALIGLPKTGKTTLFNALTAGHASTDKYAPPATAPNVGVIQVPDERVDRLSALYRPKKTIHAQIEFRDFPGIFSQHSENPESALFSEIRAAEAFVLVLRAFADEELDGLHPVEPPLRQLTAFEEEMLLADLIVAEKRLEKIELGYKRGVRTPALQFEERLLRQVCEVLQGGRPLRGLRLHAEEEKALRGFRFFSQKPLLACLNCSEADFHSLDPLRAEIAALGFPVELIAGRFEEELSRLESEEARLFMEDMGLSESIRDRFTRLCYSLLGYISFFTVGEDEVRAWTVEQGDNALTAAGKIHSDLARGFIRAECFRYGDLIAHGSEKALREKGLFRLEGKEYTVQDGDILSIRFSV